MYKDDIPVFPKFFIKEGRGNGKDGFIVPLVNFMQTPLYGVRNYHVEIVANSEDQVKDTFKVAYDMLHENAKFKGKFSVTKELITNLATGSEMKYNTSNAKTKDGKRTGCLVLNEIHAYENYDQINVFESSFGRSSIRESSSLPQTATSETVRWMRFHQCALKSLRPVKIHWDIIHSSAKLTA